jgi:hypothetical protein
MMIGVQVNLIIVTISLEHCDNLISILITLSHPLITCLLAISSSSLSTWLTFPSFVVFSFVASNSTCNLISLGYSLLALALMKFLFRNKTFSELTRFALQREFACDTRQDETNSRSDVDVGCWYQLWS